MNYDRNYERVAISNHWIIVFVVLVMMGACVGVGPTGPATETCDALIPNWLRVLQIGNIGPEDFQTWMLENDYVEEPEDLHNYLEGYFEGHFWVEFSTDLPMSASLKFDEDNRLVTVFLGWPHGTPSIDLALDCLGEPQYYSANPYHIETTVYKKLDVYYPDDGISFITGDFHIDEGITPELRLRTLRIMEPETLKEEMERARDLYEPGFTPSFREWPGDLESLIID